LKENVSFVPLIPLTIRHNADADMLTRSPCSLNIQNLYDNMNKKLVSEIRKCLRPSDPLTRGFPQDPSEGSAPNPQKFAPFLKLWIR